MITSLFALSVAELPAVNASLNACATVLLILGFVAIKSRRVTAHRNLMLAAFAVSTIFLGFYLAYHFQTTAVTKFPPTAPALARYAYYAILITHIILAAAVPFLAGFTIWLGLKDYRPRHRRWAKWTFPIWLYVSITGVVIYIMLYQLFPPPPV